MPSRPAALEVVSGARVLKFKQEGEAVIKEKRIKISHGLMALLTVLLLLCSCSVEPPELRIPWQTGEITVMEVSRDGELLFYDESRVEVDGSLLLFTSEYQFTDAPLMRRIYLDPETLLPRRSEITFTTAEGKKSALEVLYGEEEIKMSKKNGQKEEITTAPLPEPPYFDNEQLTLLVRTLPLEAGWKGKVRLFVPATAQTATINFEVVRREEVTVPAGMYDCYVVELMKLGQWAWVGVEPPCPLVKYVDESAGTISELVEYYPGGSE